MKKILLGLFIVTIFGALTSIVYADWFEGSESSSRKIEVQREILQDNLREQLLERRLYDLKQGETFDFSITNTNFTATGLTETASTSNATEKDNSGSNDNTGDDDTGDDDTGDDDTGDYASVKDGPEPGDSGSDGFDTLGDDDEDDYVVENNDEDFVIGAGNDSKDLPLRDDTDPGEPTDEEPEGQPQRNISIGD